MREVELTATSWERRERALMMLHRAQRQMEERGHPSLVIMVPGTQWQRPATHHMSPGVVERLLTLVHTGLVVERALLEAEMLDVADPVLHEVWRAMVADMAAEHDREMERAAEGGSLPEVDWDAAEEALQATRAGPDAAPR